MSTGSLGMTTCTGNNETAEPNSPEVAYAYGTSAPKIGKLTKVESSVSTTEYTEFDILGRVTASKQTTDGVTYGNGSTDSLMTYTYNLSGALIEQQYPSGRKVQNTLDQNGDLEMVKSRKNANSGYWGYANNFTYNAAGAVTSMQLGNGTWESTAFNSRLQPTQIALGTLQNGNDKMKLNYSYGTTANNGNLLTQKITVAGTGGFTADQVYTYDSLNRLTSADEKPYGWTQTNCDNDPTKCWKQTFSYDRYGNRNFVEVNTSFEGFDKLCNSNTELCSDLRKKLNPSMNASDNRLSSGQGYSFDAAGNTTRDAQDRKFTYDAENKQVKVESLSPGTQTVTGTVGEYVYDGDGRRVKKIVPSIGEVTIFVYDAGGKLIAEYSTIVATQQDAKVAYLTNDHLGSPRINTDTNGNVTARHDYHPFGEEIFTSHRTTALGYTADEIRKQFTGYERDKEIDLDYAKARMYASNLGRFTTTDPSQKSVEIISPQTWNRYTYCYNNPLTLIDENGKWPTKVHNALIDRAFSGLTRAERRIIQNGSKNTDRRRERTPYLIATRNPENAHEHAMRQEGVSFDDGMKRTDDFVRSKLAAAQSNQLSFENGGSTGLSGKALFIFGEGSHTLEDFSSPEHGPGAVYSVPKDEDGSIDFWSWHKEEIQHAWNENYEPSDEEAKPSIVRMRAAFLVVFGDNAFERAVRDKKARKEARDYLRSIGYEEPE